MEQKTILDEIIAGYPEQKQQHIRATFNRFAHGDTEEFHGQLLLILDVYGQLLERVPQKILDANRDTKVMIQETTQRLEALSRSASGLLIKVDEDVKAWSQALASQTDIINHNCQEAIQVVQTVKDRIDSEKIAAAIGESVRQTTHELVTKPFIDRTNELIKEVIPTLDQIHEASRQATRVWHRHIWTVALTSSLVLTIGFIAGARVWLYRDVDEKIRLGVTDHIRRLAVTTNGDRKAFLALVSAGASITVQKSIDHAGVENTNKYVLSLPGAYAAEMRGNDGCIYFEGQKLDNEWKEIRKLNRSLLEEIKSSKP